MASTPIEAKPSVENENATQVEVETAAADAPVTVEPADSTTRPEATPESAPVTESVPTSACDQFPHRHRLRTRSSPNPAPAVPAIPKDFPVDFTTEIFCPGPLLHQLSTYLPYGADTLGIVGEYYWIARERGTIELAVTARASPCATHRPQTPRSHRTHSPQHHRRPRSHLAIDKVEAPVE